jgi:hypothetical protein
MPKRPEADQAPRRPPAMPPDDDEPSDPATRIEDEEAEADEDDADGIGVRPGG